jgi:hypothetical protein
VGRLVPAHDLGADPAKLGDLKAALLSLIVPGQITSLSTRRTALCGFHSIDAATLG